MSFGRALLAVSLVLIAVGCGERNDLSMVPGHSLAYIHIQQGVDVSLLSMVPADMSGLPAALVEEMLADGPIGIALVAIDLSSLRPQLLLLSDHHQMQAMVSLGSKHLQCGSRDAPDRTDLVSEGGSILGSVAGRDGWTALYIGPAPESVVKPWLAMEAGASLDADSALALLSSDRLDMAVLIPGNLIQFVSVLPMGRWVPGWSRYEEIIDTVEPGAIRLDIQLTPSKLIALSVARRDGSIARISLELEGSKLTPVELVETLRPLFERLSR